jgi:hypothetical protein
MPTNYAQDYFTRWSQNKDVFVYGALTGALLYFIAIKYVVKNQ